MTINSPVTISSGGGMTIGSANGTAAGTGTGTLLLVNPSGYTGGTPSAAAPSRSAMETPSAPAR